MRPLHFHSANPRTFPHWSTGVAELISMCHRGSLVESPNGGRGVGCTTKFPTWERAGDPILFFFLRNTKKAITFTIHEISTQKLHHFKGKKSYNFLSKHENVKIDKLCKNNRDASPQGGIKSKNWARWSYAT